MQHLEDRVIARHGFHGDWNYTLLAVPRPAPDPGRRRPGAAAPPGRGPGRPGPARAHRPAARRRRRPGRRPGRDPAARRTRRPGPPAAPHPRQRLPAEDHLHRPRPGRHPPPAVQPARQRDRRPVRLRPLHHRPRTAPHPPAPGRHRHRHRHPARPPHPGHLPGPARLRRRRGHHHPRPDRAHPQHATLATPAHPKLTLKKDASQPRRGLLDSGVQPAPCPVSRLQRGRLPGSIPAEPGPVGLAFSPDSRWLYSTSEASAARGQIGTLTVISVPTAESDPAASVVSRVAAGCNPVRVISSTDGRVVWVAARANNSLLAFSAARLRTDPAHALLADVRVGELPVGLALVRNGTRVVVADSSRFTDAGASASLAVVDDLMPSRVSPHCSATCQPEDSRGRWPWSKAARPCL